MDFRQRPDARSEPSRLPALTTADHVHQRNYDWKLSHVRWGDVFKYQHWGGLLIFVPAVVILAVSHFTFQRRPVVRHALLYDATISYPTREQTIPNSQAVVYNWICLVVAVIVVELLLFRRQHSLTVALTGILHQVWCCAINFVVIVALVEVTKPFSGRLRPDFLARCQPARLVQSGGGGGGLFSSTFSSNAPTLGPVHLGEIATDCTNPDFDTVRDGRLSFPSGHACNSMSVAWFTAFYVIWSMYLRHDAPYPGRLRPVMKPKVGLLRHIGVHIVQELWHALVYAFVLLTLCLSWFIGMTRFWDNVHNVSDILGGFLVAIIFTTPFAVKAIGLHTCIKHLIDAPEVTDAAHGGPHVPGNGTGNVLPVTMQDSRAGQHGGLPPAGLQGRQGLGQPMSNDTVLNVAQPPAGAHY